VLVLLHNSFEHCSLFGASFAVVVVAVIIATASVIAFCLLSLLQAFVKVKA
jgi:hypothetical protein